MLRTKVRCGESQENHVWSKWKYQQGDSPKRREKKTRDEKYNHWCEKFTGGIQRQIWTGRKKDSANLKIGQLKRSSLENWKKKKKKIGDKWTEPQGHVRHYQVDQLSPVRVPERKERGKGKERLFEEIMAQNLQILARDMKIHIQESPWTPSRKNWKRTTPRHIITQLLKVKDKERILKARRKESNWSCTRDPQ